jgi:arabinan endo-1,5-alpha-L-arabinosidase
MEKDFFAYLRQLFSVFKTLFVWLLFSAIIISAQAQGTPDDSKGFTAHDPVMIRQDSLYYLFVTEGGIATSTDMENWTRIERVPGKLDWVTEDIVPNHRGGYWAPDIQYYEGLYFAAETERYAGIGHCAVYDFEGKTVFVAHGYDKHDEGRSKLVIQEIEWDGEDWPVLNF